jgi:hypothetical protein
LANCDLNPSNGCEVDLVSVLMFDNAPRPWQVSLPSSFVVRFAEPTAAARPLTSLLQTLMYQFAAFWLLQCWSA